MKNFYITAGLLAILTGAGFIFLNHNYINPKNKARVILDKGKLLLEQNTEEASHSAVDRFTTLVAQYPDTMAAKEGLYYLGEAYEKLGMKEMALQKYRSLLNETLTESMRRRVRFKISKMQILKSYADEGKNGLLTLLSQTHDNQLRSEIYTELGNHYLSENLFTKAQRNYEIALTENPANKEARINLTRALSGQGKDSEAYSVYDRYLTFEGALDPEKVRITARYRQEALERGLNLFKLNKMQEASRLFELVAERFPDSDEAESALYYQGVLHYKQKDYLSSIQFFNKVMNNAVKHKDEVAHLKKGEAYYQLKRYKKALKMFVRTQQLYPKSQYAQIAADWEKEIKRAMSESSTLSEPELLDSKTSKKDAEEDKEDTKQATEKTETDTKESTTEKKANEPTIETVNGSSSSSSGGTEIEEPYLDNKTITP